MQEGDEGKTIRQFTDSTTFHGPKAIFDATTRLERSYYSIAFAVACLAAVYSIQQIIAQYLEAPVSTAYVVNDAAFSALPEITICPFSRFNHRKLRESGGSAELAKYMELAFFMVNPNYPFMRGKYSVAASAMLQASLEITLQHMLDSYNNSFHQLLEAHSLKCTDLIESCEQQFQNVDCCKYSTRVMTSFGACYRLPSLNQSGAGFGMGITTMIKLPFELYGPSETNLVNDGVLIKLTEPNKGYSHDAIFLPTGTHALLQLRATKLEFKNDPPRFHCTEAADDYATFVCFQACQLSPILKLCNCSYAGLGSKSAAPVCGPNEVLSCVYKALLQTQIEDPQFTERCHQQCPERCTYWRYSVTPTYAKYPSIPLTAFSPVSVEQYRESRIVLDYYYDKLEYVLIKHEQSMTADQFVSNIGEIVFGYFYFDF